jgi:Domain of unknown function (DUF4394)
MHLSLLRRAAALATVLSLSAAGTAAATGPGNSRTLFATTDQNQLIQFESKRPERVKDYRAITGLPAGVTLAGIDFRPATGDLYGVGSDSVVYRLNPRTAIAVAEGPAFTPALNGRFFGVDFNPTVDRIRLVSDAGQNLALDPDAGTAVANSLLNPGTPRVVDAAYTNSSFNATRPTATTLYTIDSAKDTLNIQNPPAAGTQTNPVRLPFDVQDQSGFDIAGAENLGYVSTTTRRGGSGLYTVDPATGRSRFMGSIGGGRRLVVTGLAAWQD